MILENEMDLRVVESKIASANEIITTPDDLFAINLWLQMGRAEGYPETSPAIDAFQKKHAVFNTQKTCEAAIIRLQAAQFAFNDERLKPWHEEVLKGEADITRLIAIPLWLAAATVDIKMDRGDGHPGFVVDELVDAAFAMTEMEGRA